jgi:hypothetical protein
VTLLGLLLRLADLIERHDFNDGNKKAPARDIVGELLET